MSEARSTSKTELKDVLGVFLSKSQESSPTELTSKSPEIPDTQVISLCSPLSEEETFALNLLFPFCLSSYYKNRYFATNPPTTDDLKIAGKLLSGKGYSSERMKLSDNYFWLHWPDRKIFEDSSVGGMADSHILPSGSLVTVDLLRSNISGFEQTIRILDQLILVIRPQIEDLKNAYKIIKSCYYINRQLETVIIFNAHMTQGEVEKVFARFASIVSQFLVLPIRCLGAIPLNLYSENFIEEVPAYLNLDTLMLTRTGKFRPKTSSLERIRFLQKLSTIVE
ncbi:MAG: hypothetical protein HZC17_10195 [Candidatus Omnitrophica bacterium]|nr:hypothetical protein [Candidatus Omnitrophota bacterium]